MLYEDVYVGKVVCLKCGAKIDMDKLAVLDVGEMDDIPDAVKACGAFFQTLACPECKKSLYFGFVAEAEEVEKEEKEEKAKPAKKTRKRRKKRSKKAKQEVEVEDIREEDFEPPPRIARAADGTIDLDAPVVARKVRQQATCTRCNNLFDVGTEGIGGFGSKCPDCMRLLVSEPGAAGVAKGIRPPSAGQPK
jgi:uncharacterized Zn finger protein (UPF0148 family)